MAGPCRCVMARQGPSHWGVNAMARVVCPACKQAGNIPEEFLGQRIKCPHCNERFSAPGQPPTLPGAKRVEPSPATTRPAPPLEVASAPLPATVQAAELAAIAAAPLPAKPETKGCPYCGEEILAIALKCKHCGEYLDVALRAAEEAKRLAMNGNAPSQVVSVNSAASAASAAVATPAGDAYTGAALLFGMGTCLFLAGFVVKYFFPIGGIIVMILGGLQGLVAVVILVMAGLQGSTRRTGGGAVVVQADSVHRS